MHARIRRCVEAAGNRQSAAESRRRPPAEPFGPDPIAGAETRLSAPFQEFGINGQGIASGYYQKNDGSQHGLLYDTTSQQYFFIDDPSAATSGVSITQITGINNHDEIAGFYVDAASGLQPGFVASLASTPEPATFAMLGWALIGLAALRRRQTR
jgi:hypothetical protein